MPDVTSTLLAMYQQVIGGSTAREQSSVEAECARRVITSGLTIAPNGTFTVPGNVTIGGSLTVNGSFALLGTLTVGTLAVTGTVTVGGTLGVTGLLTAGSLSVTGTASVGGLLTASAGLTVTGNTAIAGLLTVTGLGAHTFIGTGTGPMDLMVRHTAAGATNQTRFAVGNDTDPYVTFLASFASNFSGSPYQQPNGSLLFAGGAGGMSIYSASTLRMYTTGIERMRIASNGVVFVNTTNNAAGTLIMVAYDEGQGVHGLGIQSLATSGTSVSFINPGGAVVGGITQTNTAVTYTTTSDARLKDDAGHATDLSALRAVVVHDFTWKADGIRDRGVFAQEAHARFPRAVVAGTDETTETGDLARPWMTDYSKFVPDLIVGWQHLDAEVTALRALLAQERI